MTTEAYELPPGMHPTIPNCENYEDRHEQDAWMEIAAKYGFKYDGDGTMIPPGWLYTGELLRFCREVHDAAILAERERCAQICESVNNHDNPMTANDCAAAIRAG
jgi:hypothetical protein